MYWINGVPKKVISLDNRALHFGDGFFTTARLKNSQVNFLDAHMDRLVLSARRLMFDNINFNLLYKEILQAASYSVSGIIKVIISRINNRNSTYGYQYDKNTESLRIIRTSKLSQNYIKWNKSGVRLKISSIRLARNSFFSGIKHLNRLEQCLMIASEIYKDNMIDEALVLDTDGNIIECCSANIFWRKNYQVFTPSLHYSGVNGIIRQLILRLLPSLGYDVREVMVGVEHLKNIDEVFITNSLLPLAFVKTIGNNTYSNKTLFNLLSTQIIK